MANKLSFILSLFFLMQIIAYSGDLSILSMLYTTLDSISVNVATQIASEGMITDEIRTYVVNACSGANIEAIGDCIVGFGEVFRFRIYKSYQPLIMSEQPMEVSLTRSTVVGYLNP